MRPLKGGSTVPVSWGSGPHWDVDAQRRFYSTYVIRLGISFRCGCSKEGLLYLCHEAQDLIEMWLLKEGCTVPVSWGSGPHWDVAAQRRFYSTCVMRIGTSLRCSCSKEVVLYLCHEARDLIDLHVLEAHGVLELVCSGCVLLSGGGVLRPAVLRLVPSRLRLHTCITK